MKSKKIIVKGSEISVLYIGNEDYISLTDLARYKDALNMDDIIKKWIETTNSIGIISKSGRYGGTFAHRDKY